MSENVITPEEPTLTYSFKSPTNGRTYTRHLFEIVPGFYKVVTSYRGSKLPPQVSRQPGGIVLYMLEADLENVIKVVTKKGRFINSFSYYDTGLETNVQNERILLSIDDKGKYVAEVHNLAYFD